MHLEKVLLLFTVCIVSTVLGVLNESLVYFSSDGGAVMQATLPFCKESSSASAKSSLRLAEAFLHKITKLNENPEAGRKFGYAIQRSCSEAGLSLLRKNSPTTFFSLALPCRAQVGSAAEFVASSSWKHAVVVVSDDECGLGNLKDFYVHLEQLGGKRSNADVTAAATATAVKVSYYVTTATGSIRPPRLNGLPGDMAVNLTDVAGLVRSLKGHGGNDSGLILLTGKNVAAKMFRQLELERLPADLFDWLVGDLWEDEADSESEASGFAWDYFASPSAKATTKVFKLQMHVSDRKLLDRHFRSQEKHSESLNWLRREIYGSDCVKDECRLTSKKYLFPDDTPYVMVEAIRAAAVVAEGRDDGVSLTKGGVRFVRDAGHSMFRPFPRYFDIMSVIPGLRRGDFVALSHSRQNTYLETVDETDFADVVVNNNCVNSISKISVIMPAIAFIFFVAAAVGLILNRQLLPSVYRFIYIDIITIASVFASVAVAVASTSGVLPLGQCDELTADFISSIVTAVTFSAAVVAVVSHRVKLLSRGNGRRMKPSLIAIRFVALAALFMIFSGIQIAVSGVSSFVAGNSCKTAFFYVSHSYSSLLGLIAGLFALVKPLPVDDTFEFQYQTKPTKAVLFLGAGLHLILNVVYMAGISCQFRQYLLVVLMCFPVIYVACLIAALVAFIRNCYNSLTKDVPIQIELINPLQEIMLARTADIWSNKYAGSMRIKKDREKGGTLARHFPFQISDRELIKEVKPVFISPDRLAIGAYIGGGNFGQVFKGTLDGSTPVAVKTIRGSFSHEELEDFLKEGLRMKDFDHPNVMRLIGIGYGRPVDQDNDSGVQVLPVCVLPYMAKGDLKRYLTEGRPGQPTHQEFFPDPVANRIDLSLQVARGMLYLARQRIVHRDLAARNCMVDDGRRVMVGDFGLARSLEGVIYRQKKNICLPFMWMAIESLIERTFSTASDVWSYGVTLWEIMTYGRRPYLGIYSSDALVEYLLRGKRMTKPDDCDGRIYEIMASTWTAEFSERPSFEDIISKLEKCARLGKNRKQADIAIDTMLEEFTEDSEDPGYTYDHLQGDVEVWYKTPRPVSDVINHTANGHCLLVNANQEGEGPEYVNSVVCSEAEMTLSYVTRVTCMEQSVVCESTDAQESDDVVDEDRPADFTGQRQYYINCDWTRTSTSCEKETTL
eukprot:m.9882 g.9882  ORF g.9882 m.9882 type:complete len:1178 (+) comp21712_c0_seq2:2831-6364(+)